MGIKNALIISSYILDDACAATERLRGYTNSFISAGYKVDVLSPSVTRIENVHKNIVLNHDINLKSFFLRAITELLYVKKVFKYLKKNDKYDVVLISCPSIFLVILGASKKKNMILDIRDLTWKYLPSKYIFLKLIFDAFYLYFANKFNHIFVANTDQLSFFKKNKRFESKLNLLENGISQKRWNILSQIAPKKSLNQNIDILFCGNLAPGRGLEILLQICKDDKDINVTIIGGGPLYNLLKENEINYSNLNILGPMSWEEVVNYYIKTDILFAQLSQDFSGAIPSKLYEYLSSKRIVIYGGEGLAKRLIDEIPWAVSIQSDSYLELKLTIENIKQSYNYKAFAESNIYSKRFIRELKFETFIDIIS